MRRGEIPPELLNSFTEAYQARGVSGLQEFLGGLSGRRVLSLNSYAKTNDVTFEAKEIKTAKIEAILERVERALGVLPSRMPRTTVNANKRGFFTIMTSEQKIRQREQKIAK